MRVTSDYNFALRVPSDIKEDLAISAKKKRLSLNQWIVQAIEEKLERDSLGAKKQ